MSFSTTLLDPEVIAIFSEDARRAVYDCIALRRDIRHFQRGAEIEPAVLDRILAAAHQAPSVGFSQPWVFVVIRDADTRERVQSSFLRCREAEASRFPADRRDAYLAHKLEGICEASLNLCVAVDLRDRGEAILGTTVQPEAVRASACCAVQNLWLAARSEGIGVGWVSILDNDELRAILGIPKPVVPVAYLCIGYAQDFLDEPELQRRGWAHRLPLGRVIYRERWEGEGLGSS